MIPAAADPLLTVIVPTHNGANYVGRTLTSLRLQTLRDLEVIVVDDGSADDTCEIVRQHAVGARLVTQANHGVAVARNRGLAEARGRFVAFLDQDDLWHPTRLEVMTQWMKAQRAPVLATTEQAFALNSDREALATVGDGRQRWPSHWVDDGEEIDLLLLGDTLQRWEANDVELITRRRLLLGPATVTTAMVYERRLAIAAGGCATHAVAIDDHVLNIAVARLTGPIPRLRFPSVFYRVHGHSTTTTTSLTLPFATTLLALRHGGLDVQAGRGSLPDDVGAYHESPYLQHLLDQLARSEIAFSDRTALTWLLVRDSPGRVSAGRVLVHEQLRRARRMLRRLHDRRRRSGDHGSRSASAPDVSITSAIERSGCAVALPPASYVEEPSASRRAHSPAPAGIARRTRS